MTSPTASVSMSSFDGQRPHLRQRDAADDVGQVAGGRGRGEQLVELVLGDRDQLDLDAALLGERRRCPASPHPVGQVLHDPDLELAAVVGAPLVVRPSRRTGKPPGRPPGRRWRQSGGGERGGHEASVVVGSSFVKTLTPKSIQVSSIVGPVVVPFGSRESRSAPGWRDAMPTGPGEILDLIRHGRAQTRGDVLEVTGLSRVTVAQRIDALLDAGPDRRGGARRVPLAGGAGAASSSTPSTAHVVVGSGGHDAHPPRRHRPRTASVMADETIEAPVHDGPSTCLDPIAEAMAALLARRSSATDDLCGVGISVPGPVDPASGRPSEPPIMPGWDAYPIVEHLGSALPGSLVVTANDADAAAVGEHATNYPQARAFCAVQVSTGIGTGIVVDGRHLPRRRRRRRGHRTRAGGSSVRRPVPVRRPRLPRRRGERSGGRPSAHRARHPGVVRTGGARAACASATRRPPG